MNNQLAARGESCKRPASSTRHQCRPTTRCSDRPPAIQHTCAPAIGCFRHLPVRGRHFMLNAVRCSAWLGDRRHMDLSCDGSTSKRAYEVQIDVQGRLAFKEAPPLEENIARILQLLVEVWKAVLNGGPDCRFVFVRKLSKSSARRWIGGYLIPRADRTFFRATSAANAPHISAGPLRP